jgi:hypothetical protein
MWYLRDRYFDVVEAEQKLRAMMKWRAGFRCGRTELLQGPTPASSRVWIPAAQTG